jgi:hypothetical protein
MLEKERGGTLKITPTLEAPSIVITSHIKYMQTTPIATPLTPSTYKLFAKP